MAPALRYERWWERLAGPRAGALLIYTRVAEWGAF